MTTSVFISFNAFGQTTNSLKLIDNQKELYNSLKKSVDNKWVRNNPVLIHTKTSFFNEENESKYFVGLLQISGQSVPFTWDDNLSLLKYLLALDNEINIKQGIEADKNYKGTKITWNKEINGLIWFNNKIYNASVDNWHIFELTDCPGTIIFPNLSFNKVTEVSDALTNNIQGLIIFPYNENLKNIKSSETTVKVENGNTIKGIGYDVNNDGIFDIFSFFENLDETTNYIRLYININGQWVCKWVNLYEECI